MEKFKEFKGTKGEWEVGKSFTYLVGVEKPVARYIAVCDGDKDLTQDEVEFNAKLIAAAPNLLQALQELYYLVSELPEEGSLIEALANAKAAIEKAL